MEDRAKTKEQLLEELTALRQRVSRLEGTEPAWRQAEENAQRLDALLRSLQTVNELISSALSAREKLERIKERIAESTEPALAQQQDLWRIAFASSPDLLALKNAALTYVAANPSFCQFLGRKEKEIVGKADFDLFSPSEAETCRRNDAQAMANGEPLIHLEQITGATGPSRLLVSRSSVLDEAGECVGVLFSGRPANGQEETGATVLVSEAPYRAVVEDQTELIWRFLPDGALTFANDVFCRFWDKKREELVGRPFVPVMPDADREKTQEMFSSLEPERPTGSFEHRVIVPGGHVRWLRGTVRARFGEDGRVLGFQCVARDVTEEKQLEAQIRQAQKMRAVGQLASGCAHHFNNLLTVINGYAQVLVNALADAPLRREAESILKAGERAASLTSQLLAFGCPTELQATVLDLNEVVKDVGDLLHGLLGEDIVLKINLAEGLGRVRANSGQMEVVVLNLVTNARDAMPSGGVLTLETRNIKLDTAYVVKHPEFEPGRYVMLMVSDSGHGMTPEVRERIFEPFFTTKEPGTSTGMGLATVYGIVEQNGGHIEVYSEPNLGTTFKIYMPRVDEIQQLELPAISGSDLPRGTETILVLEDQEQVREFAADMLKHLGYNVLAASNGNDALALCLTLPDSIDLLLTDVVMPNMSGPEFVERLRQLRPGFVVMYMSGYAGSIIANRGAVSPGYALIQKPFTIDSLAREVRRALNRRDR